MPEPQWEPYEYPELDVKEYNQKLEALLWRRFYAGELAIEGKTLKPNEKNTDKATNYINDIVRQTISEGVNPRLPFYNEVITATMTPEWYQGQVGRYQQDWAKWGEEQVGREEVDWARQFGVQQWQQAEAWRRYGAETQQQQIKAQREHEVSMWHREQQLSRQGLQFQQQELANLRYAGALSGGLGGENEAAQRRSQETVWEDWRKRILGGIDPNRQWIQHWQLSQQQNPYAPKDESPFDVAQELKADWEYAKERADYYQKRMKDPNDPLTQMGVGMPTTPEQAAASGWLTRAAILGQQYEKEMESPEMQMTLSEKASRERGRERAREAGWGADYGGFRMPPEPRYTTPETPSWLGEMYPSLGARIPEVGQRPEGFGLAPPSGQQWGRLSPSQRGQWAGFASYMGGKPEDLLAQMEQMRPRYRPGVRWQPSRQRA